MKKNKLLKKLSKLNVSTIFFFILSLVSTTFAWFAYNNAVNSDIDIELKSWDLAITEEGEEINKLIDIRIDNFSPGVETYVKTIEIHNNGDMAAVLDFEIESLRILDDEYPVENREELIDSLAHDYPYFFNFTYDTNFIKLGEVAIFNVTIGWPLDSGNDALDSEWGMAAYEFYHDEQVKLANDPTYEVRPCIEAKVRLNSKQYVPEENISISDNYYRIGYSIPYDNHDTYIIDIDNKVEESTVNALHMYTDLEGNSYDQASTYNLVTAEDILKLVSTDIFDTLVKTTGISDRVLGIINNDTRATSELNELIANNSYVEFDASKFALTNSTACFWTGSSADETRAFAVKKEGTKYKLYLENKNTNCYYIMKTRLNKLCSEDDCKLFYINGVTYMAEKDATWGGWIGQTHSSSSYHNGIVCVTPDTHMAGVESGSCNNSTPRIRDSNNMEPLPSDTIVENEYYRIRY